MIVMGEHRVVAQSQAASSSPSPSDYVCVKRGPHYKNWQRSTLETNQFGIIRTNQEAYTELATGLCHLENQQYVDSVEEIDAVANGAQATQGRYQVQWAANANTSGGAVNLTTADNKRLLSTVYGLAYSDPSTGSNVMLAQLQDCTATIVAPNVLIYPNAFSNLTADLRYTYRKAGMSQDVILKQQPPSPAEYGLNPGTTRLQVLTEFFTPPAPNVTMVTANGSPNDVSLDFGDMKMGVGHAFLFKSDTEWENGGAVMKHWVVLDNRTFLIEEIPYASVSNMLASLHTSLIKPDKHRVRRTVLLDRPIRHKVSAIQTSRPVKVATTKSHETGLVMDYDLVSGASGMVFQSDTTYFVSGLCSITGAALFEGGTVIKYTNNSTAEIDLTNVVCETAPYRPAVFTSMNDNTVGAGISGSTGNPWGDNAGAVALSCQGAPLIVGYYSGSATLQNVKFSHLAACISLDDDFGDFGGNLEMSDFQAVDCGQVIMSADAQCYLFNGLVYQVGKLFGVKAGDGDDGGQSLTAINLTVHHCGTYASDQTSYMYFTNCLFAEVTNIYSIPSFTFTNSSYFLSNDSGVFQTVGAGAHYLADDTYRRLGTTNIGTDRWQDLQTKTTYPPVTNVAGTLTNDLTLFPQAERDNGSSVDIGFHYDPIDYSLGFEVENAALTVLPGTALAVGPGNEGIAAANTAGLQFLGTATQPIIFTRYCAVQEVANTNWSLSTTGTGIVTYATNLNFRFVNFTDLGNSTTKIFNIQGSGEVCTIPMFGCEFYNGRIESYDPNLWVTNCMFQRVAWFIQDSGPNYHNFYNNLFEAGSLDTQHDEADFGGTWTFKDSLFDEILITNEMDPPDVADYNAFITNHDTLISPIGSHDKILSNRPAYEYGTLGQYYYASGLPLINAGSQTAAAAGLYHFTVLTNNVPETNSTVSIGFHYVATDANGNPLDTDGDGIPDYIEDSNGDGMYDFGDRSSWTNYTSPSGLTASSGLQVFTPLK